MYFFLFQKLSKKLNINQKCNNQVTGHSTYMDKDLLPSEEDLKRDLGSAYDLWDYFRNLVLKKYPEAIQEWNFPGKNYGWSFRMKDKRRAIIYFLPRKEYFLLAFVFGDKATRFVLESKVAADIKERLSTAKKYAEGRGIRIEIHDDHLKDDIETLIDIKLAN